MVAGAHGGFRGNTMPASLNGGPPNIFVGLFNQQPREFARRDEDFLTEALAYVVATEDGLQADLVRALTGGLVVGARVAEVETQLPVAKPDDSRCRPDLRMAGIDGEGRRFELWLENKWGAPLSEDQLTSYREQLARTDAKVRHLVFVSRNFSHVDAAGRLLKVARRGVTGSALAWRDLHAALGPEDERPGLLAQFRRFLTAKGLGALSAVTLEDALAYRKARDDGKRLGSANSYRRTLQGLCETALKAHLALWSTEELRVWDAWGRAALYDPSYRASVGMLYDPGDHRTRFIDPARPTDIVIRIQAEPAGQSTEALEALRGKFKPLAAELETLGYDCNPGGGSWALNRHTLLLGHYRPGFPWEAKTGAEQAARLAEIFQPALEALRQSSVSQLIFRLPRY